MSAFPQRDVDKEGSGRLMTQNQSRYCSGSRREDDVDWVQRENGKLVCLEFAPSET